jgi:hypothetical protein
MEELEYPEEQKLSPLKAIRKKCMDCAGSRGEVRKCNVLDCWLHPFRFGKNPFRKKVKLTVEQRKEIRNRLAKGLEKK